MNKFSKVAIALGLSAATLSASGWRIPEQSLNSTALSAAYVAGANGADASYYNPANMVFMEEGSFLESALTYINLPSISYTDANNAAYDGDSEVEHFIVPTLHYVSPKYGDFRYGLSIVAPGGLSKRWNDAYQKVSAEEFTLEIIEFNPTMSYMVNENFAIGIGARAVYTKGVVKSNGNTLGDLNSDGTPETLVNISRDLSGDSIDFGYNLALTYKATDKLTLAATYRSKVDLTVEGDAVLDNTIVATSTTIGHYNGSASVTIPLPASLALAANYDFGKTNVELVFERTYWSSYKELDFDYDNDLSATALAAFDAAIAKNWKDANAYRIGVTHQYNDKLKLMAGFAYDEAGAPSDTIGFELPESDAKLYSAGFEYKLDEQMSIGLAYLFDQKKTLTLDEDIEGTFEDSSAHLVTASFKYKF